MVLLAVVELSVMSNTLAASLEFVVDEARF